MNSFRSDPTGWLGALAMLGFANWAGWRWSHTGMLFFLLLVLRDATAAWFLMSRRATNQSRLCSESVIAYFSSALPLCYAAPPGMPGPGITMLGEFLPILGFALSSIALIDLGRSFGVAPAMRDRVRVGVYSFLQHPMYSGYVVAELGMVLLNPKNSGIFLTSAALYWLRARWESRLWTTSEFAAESL